MQNNQINPNEIKWDKEIDVNAIKWDEPQKPTNPIAPKKETTEDNSFMGKATRFGKEFIDNTVGTFAGYRPFNTDTTTDKIMELTKRTQTGNAVIDSVRNTIADMGAIAAEFDPTAHVRARVKLAEKENPNIIDFETTKKISAINNPMAGTFKEMIGELIGSDSLKESGKRTVTPQDIQDYKDSVYHITGDKYDIAFDDEDEGKIYVKPKGSNEEFKPVLSDIFDTRQGELLARMEANMPQFVAEAGGDAGGAVLGVKVANRINALIPPTPYLIPIKAGVYLVGAYIGSTVGEAIGSGTGAVVQAVSSGQKLSDDRIKNIAIEEATDTTLANLAIIGAFEGTRALYKLGKNINPISQVGKGKDDYLKNDVYEVPNSTLEKWTSVTTENRKTALQDIARRNAQLEDIYKDFGGIMGSQAKGAGENLYENIFYGGEVNPKDMLEMAGQNNPKEILGDHFNHSQARVNAEIENSIQLTKNFKTKFGLSDRDSSDFYRMLRGGVARIKSFYENYYGQAQKLIQGEMGEANVKIASETQKRLDELIEEANKPLNVELDTLSEAQKSEFTKDYNDLLALTKRDFTKDMEVWNELKGGYDIITVNTESYTINGLFDLQKKFNAFFYKHKDKFTQPQREALKGIKETIYQDVFRAIDTHNTDAVIKLQMKELWIDANSGYKNFKMLEDKNDLFKQLVSKDTKFDVFKFANDMFKQVNMQDSQGFDILYTLGKELKRTGSDMNQFYSSILEGFIMGARRVENQKSGEITQGLMESIQHKNTGGVQILNFDAFHTAFNQIDPKRLEKIFSLSEHGQKMLYHLKNFDKLAKREAVLQQNMISKEFKYSVSGQEKQMMGKLFYSTIYGIKYLLWNSWAKYIKNSTAYESFFLRALEKRRYEDIEPLLKKLDYDQKQSVSLANRVDVTRLKNEIELYKKLTEQAVAQATELEKQTGKTANQADMENLMTVGLLEHKPAVFTANQEGRVKTPFYDDKLQEKIDWNYGERLNPAPNNTTAVGVKFDNDFANEKMEALKQQDVAGQQIDGQIGDEIPRKEEDGIGRIIDGMNSPRANKFSVITSLKTPIVNVYNYLKKNDLSAKKTFQKKADYFKENKGNIDININFNDADFNEYYKIADEIMPTFQGAKNEMATVVPQVVKKVFTPDERSQIDTVWDYFGGGGAWGVFMTKIDNFPNIKTLNIAEYSPARKQKIEVIHNHHKEVFDFYNGEKFYNLITSIIKEEKALGKAGSGDRIAGQILEVIKRDKDNFSDIELASLYNTMDYMNAAFEAKDGADAVVRNISKMTKGIGKAIDELKSRGITINYHNIDSYTFDHEAGENVLAIIDPPYLKTKAYSYLDMDEGIMKQDSIVGMDTYYQTWKLYDSLKNKGNSVVYTDEAYYRKDLMKDYVKEDEAYGDTGKNAFEMTQDMAQKSDIFMEVPVGDRIETLGIIKSNKFKARGTNDTATRNTKNDLSHSNTGEDRANGARGRSDDGARGYNEVDKGDVDETTTHNQLPTPLDGKSSKNEGGTGEPRQITLKGYRYGGEIGADGHTYYHQTKKQAETHGGGFIHQKEIKFNKLLDVQNDEIGYHENLPSEYLFNEWKLRNKYNKHDEMIKRGIDTKDLQSDGLIIDILVNKEARDRGYDGIRYGDFELVDLHNGAIANKIDTPKTSDDFKSDLANISEQTLIDIDKSTGGGAGRFYQNLKEIQDPTQYQIDEFYKALEHPSVKYPYNEAPDKIEQLEGLLKSSNDLGVSFGDVFNGNTVKAIKADLKKDGAVRERLVSNYEELMRTYDELEPRIKTAYPNGIEKDNRSFIEHDGDLLEVASKHTDENGDEIVVTKDDKVFVNGDFMPFSNQHIGAGVIVGGANATEEDENGNITFDPEKFVVGFLAGAGVSKLGAEALKRVNPKKYNSLLGTADKFPTLAEHNPKLLADLYKKAPYQEGIAGMFAGEKAIKADIKKLDSAIKMVRDGKNEADVWKETGWFKGDDGKWRFEIDDTKVDTKKMQKYKSVLENLPSDTKEITTSKLFGLIKELKSEQVYNKELVEILANNIANGKYNLVALREALMVASYGNNIDIIKRAKNKKIAETLINNGQTIKKMILDEGFSEKDIKPAFRVFNNIKSFKVEPNVNKKDLVLSDIIDHKQLFDNYPTLKNISIRYMSIMNGQGAYDPTTNSIDLFMGLSEKETKSAVLHEIQHAIQHIENMARGGSIKGVMNGKSISYDEAVEFYTRYHGEAEARLTQARADNGYERFPYNDLDVPRNELVNRFDDGVDYQAKVLEKDLLKNDGNLKYYKNAGGK